MGSCRGTIRTTLRPIYSDRMRLVTEPKEVTPDLMRRFRGGPAKSPDRGVVKVTQFVLLGWLVRVRYNWTSVVV